jgi:hypothetical protein
MEIYAAQARNNGNERRACEIRLRAERRCGQLLKQAEKAKGTQGQLNGRDSSGGSSVRPPEEETQKSLSDLGISKTQSSRWQQLADVPEAEFEATMNMGAKPSTTGIVQTKAGRPCPWPLRPLILYIQRSWLTRYRALTKTAPKATS